MLQEDIDNMHIAHRNLRDELQTQSNEDWIYYLISLLKLYKRDENGTQLYLQIQKDWHLFENENFAHDYLSECCLLPEIQEFGFTADTLVVYNEQIQQVTETWKDIKNTIKHQTRYHIDDSPLDQQNWNSSLGDCVEIYNSRNRVKYYRARIPHTEGARYKCKEMGAPNPEYATSGRANPMGISYLYVCTEVDTCLYETRAAYLDRICIGTFKIKPHESVSLMNLTRIKADKMVIPVDGDDLEGNLKIRILINLISRDLSEPMRRHDSIVEYIPTQFICEYIRDNYHVDGIIYTSSLNDSGTNIVFFNPDKLKCTKVQDWQVSRIDISGTPME